MTPPFALWSDFAAYVAAGHKVNCAHLVKIELGDGPFRFWNGRYPLSAFGAVWQPTYGQITMSEVSTDNEAYVPGSYIEVRPQNFEFARIVLGDYDANALYRPIERYAAFFADDWRTPLFADLITIQSGILDSPTYRETPEGVAVTIPIEGALTTQRLPQLGYYTQDALQRRYPDALGFEFISIIEGTEVAWLTY